MGIYNCNCVNPSSCCTRSNKGKQEIRFCVEDANGDQYILCAEKDSCGSVSSGPIFLDAMGNLAVPVAPIKLCPREPQPASQIVDNGNGTFTHIAGDGAETLVDITAAILASGLTDSLEALADGSFEHTAIDGTTVVIPAQVHSSFTVNADGSATHVSGDGTETILPAPANNSIIDNGDNTYTIVLDDDTVTIDINHPDEVSHILPPQADGSYIYFDLDGNQHTMPADTHSSLEAHIDGSFHYTSADGEVTIIPAPTYSSLNVPGDGTFTHTDGAGNETIYTPPTVTASQLTVNADGSMTHIAGGVTTLVPAPTHSALTVNADGSATHVSGDGTEVTIPAPPVSTFTDNGDRTITHDDGRGNTVTVALDNGTDTLVNQGDGTILHTALDGSQTTIDPCALLIAGGCAALVQDNNDGTGTIFDNQGNSITVVLAP